MARYKDYSYDQHKFIPVSFEQQILPGTFEYTLFDHEVDLSVFEARYRNDETGAPRNVQKLDRRQIIPSYRHLIGPMGWLI